MRVRTAPPPYIVRGPGSPNPGRVVELTWRGSLHSLGRETFPRVQVPKNHRGSMCTPRVKDCMSTWTFILLLQTCVCKKGALPGYYDIDVKILTFMCPASNQASRLAGLWVKGYTQLDNLSDVQFLPQLCGPRSASDPPILESCRVGETLAFLETSGRRQQTLPTFKSVSRYEACTNLAGTGLRA